MGEPAQDYPIMYIFSPGPSDRVVEALRAAMRREGATPQDDRTSASNLPVNGREIWERAEGKYELTNHEGGVLLEALPWMLDDITRHVRPETAEDA